MTVSNQRWIHIEKMVVAGQSGLFATRLEDRVAAQLALSIDFPHVILLGYYHHDSVAR